MADGVKYFIGRGRHSSCPLYTAGFPFSRSQRLVRPVGEFPTPISTVSDALSVSTRMAERLAAASGQEARFGRMVFSGFELGPDTVLIGVSRENPSSLRYLHL